jgi:hypothetical protein
MYNTLTGPPSTSAYSNTGLQNSTKHSDMTTLKKDKVKAKVGYEWKKIFKELLRLDNKSTGSVSRDQFLAACS